MKIWVLALVLVGVFSGGAGAECSQEARLLKSFVGLRLPIGDCTGDLYHPNGKTAYSAYYGDWYHSNGKTAYSKYYGDWYYDNGKTAYSKYYGDWYYENGKTAYSKYYGDIYYQNGKTMFSKYYGDWYWENGKTAYSKYYGALYYESGSKAADVKDVDARDMIEFIFDVDCNSKFNFYCAISQLIE